MSDSGIKALSSAEVLATIQAARGIFWWNNNWLPEGMIVAEQGGTGSVEWYNHAIWLLTGATSGGWAHVEKTVMPPLPTTWEKKRYFRADVLMPKKLTQYLHVGTGKYPNSGSGNTFNHVGFLINGDDIFGTVANGTSESILLLDTLTADGQDRILEVVYTPGVEARFYVDGVDKGVRITNLPSGTLYSGMLFGSTVENTSDYLKQLWIRQIKVYQEG